MLRYLLFLLYIYLLIIYLSRNKNIQIKNIDIENIIWVIYIIIILLALLSNYYEKNSIVNNNYQDGIDSKNINIFIFIVLVIIYLYFLNNSYNQYRNNPSDINYTNLMANVFNVIGGFIFLYVAINANVDSNIDI